MPDTQPTTSPVGDLRGRVALVTGVGRKRGIGSAVCRALASRGANVAFSYWRDYDRETPGAPEEDEPEALLGELRAIGVGAEGVEVDLSLPDSARLLLDGAEEVLGRPSILVNVAAYSSRDSFEDLDARTLDAHYAVNPGPTDTGWMTEELEQELIHKFPLGRIGQPGDVARLVAFLASEEAAWITGQIIHSEGGFSRS